MLDLASLDGVDPDEQERVLLHELGEYQPELLERPRIVLGTKADIVPDVGPFVAGRPERLVISAVTGDGVRKAVGAMAAAVHEARQREERQEGVVLLRPQPTGAMVERVGEHEYRVHGRDVERVVALNDVSTFEATAYISHRLERLGVNRLLARAGAQDGDVVWIGAFSFEYKGD
jgi:GTP-binding protein